MFSNAKSFVAPLVILFIACMAVEAVPVEAVPVETASVEVVAANSFPQWCYCAYLGDYNEYDTQNACSWAGGNFDGHTCGCNNQDTYDSFGRNCNSVWTWTHAVCWS